MTTLTKERRAEIRAAAEKATPGPWEVGPVDDTVVTHLGADGLRYEVAGIDGDYNSPGEWPTMEANATHIANCDPQTILALLDALDAAEAGEVAVKPLEFDWAGEQCTVRYAASRAFWVGYRIGLRSDGRKVLHVERIGAEDRLGDFGAWDDAEAAAQADYEARIRSALQEPTK